MKKSTYSLILSEEIIRRLDDIAYASKTSRSNYVNQVLAEHISYTTPEQRIRDILDTTKEFLQPDGKYAFVEMSSNSYMDIRSALNYKYRPTIRYGIELVGVGAGPFFRLRVQIRTQSSKLITDVSHFFELWESIETKHLKDGYEDQDTCSYGNICYARSFYLKDSSIKNSESDLGKAIAKYIVALNNALNVFLDNSGNMHIASKKVLDIYENYNAMMNIII